MLARDGIVDRWPVVAEPFRQWVLEDDFVAGRPGWEHVGVLFTDDVHAWELYKLRILNAGHSCMAYLCALAGITFVDEAMAIPEVRGFVSRLLYEEAVPALTAIPGYPRAEYAATVLKRFANPGVRDQIARLCIDGTAKFPTFLVPTIEHHLEHGGPVRHAALALAGWARANLATFPIEQQSADTYGEASRGRARTALDDPVRFLDLDAVFTSALRESAALPKRVRRRRRGFGDERTDGGDGRSGRRRDRTRAVTSTAPSPGRLQYQRQRDIYGLALKHGSVDVSALGQAIQRHHRDDSP